MERFTSEDIKALREYLDKLEAINQEPQPEHLTPEEWDEALKAIEKTGKIPAKFAGRIAKGEEGYYDVARNAHDGKFVALRDEYFEVFKKVMLSNFEDKLEDKTENKTLEEIIRLILENPVILRELEKEARKLERREFPALGALPNTEPLNLLYHVMIGSKGGRIIQGTNTNRHEVLNFNRGTDGSLTYTRENRGNITTVEIKSATLLFENYHKGFTKILTFVLQEMAAQNFPHFLGFPLSEMVSLGMYGTMSNARRALSDFFTKQDNIMIGGQVKKGKKTVSQSQGKLFYDLKIDNNFAVLSVNENLNWEYLASYFTVFPRFAYRLNINAFALVRYIFYIARQNAKKIKETGKFTISLEAVREQIGLPTVEEAGKRTKQFIIDPIEAAIAEIETALTEVEEAKDYGFTITPVRTDTNKIREWLQGYLEIGLSGKFAESFIQIATRAEQERAKAKRARLKP